MKNRPVSAGRAWSGEVPKNPDQSSRVEEFAVSLNGVMIHGPYALRETAEWVAGGIPGSVVVIMKGDAE